MSRQTQPNTTGVNIPPIFISVKEAARLLSLTPWSIYQLCDQEKIQAQYHGKRRLVRYSSVLAYADSLSAERDAS